MCYSSSQGFCPKGSGERGKPRRLQKDGRVGQRKQQKGPLVLLLASVSSKAPSREIRKKISSYLRIGWKDRSLYLFFIGKENVGELGEQMVSWL